MSRLVRVVAALVLVLLAPLVADAHGPESDAYRVHTVYSGQRLGSIAKRYNVTIDALCNANGIKRHAPIHPGDKLIVPKRSDKDGSEARKFRLSGEWQEESGKTKKRTTRSSGDAPGQPRTHTVYSGQRLGSIAKRYNVTVSAICNANDIKKNSPIHPGQKLLIPARDDKDGSYARQVRDGTASGAGGTGSWKKYRKRPKRRGYVKLLGHTEKWEGRVVNSSGSALPGVRRHVSRVLSVPESKHLIHPRLIKLLAKVSDTFGGRTLRVISGYRTTSFVKGSKHKTGRAVDFRIPGVPNKVLCDYLRTFDDVGVGYYPNSTFVHVDVRDRSAYWVDYAGPGEAPRLKPKK